MSDETSALSMSAREVIPSSHSQRFYSYCGTKTLLLLHTLRAVKRKNRLKNTRQEKQRKKKGKRIQTKKEEALSLELTL